MGAFSLIWPLLFTLIPLSTFIAISWALFNHALPWQFTWVWVAALDVELAFRVDGLSALMLLMITGIGLAVFVYTGGYLADHPARKRAYLLLTLFLIAMAGSVTADHLLVLFMFWEGTSLLSFLLVGFYHERESSRKSAQQSLLVTGSGGLILLAGFILLGEAVGSYRLSGIIATLPDIPQTHTLHLAMLLILVGAFTKSAQIPFHFWLPNAMSAPTPVSAYLHSATMVKLGVYLLARLDPGFGDWVIWELLLKGVGSVTAAWGMILTLRERDLKRILAWSTVATLGTLVVLVGLRSENASVAVGLLLLAHALYKAPLFFVAGNIDHCTGTRQLDRLGGLRRQMPWTALAALLAAASMAGLPLSFGFVAKEVIMDAKSAGDVFLFARIANTVFGIIAVAVAGTTAIRVFWLHPPAEAIHKVHECGPALLMPPLILALVGIGLGIFPFMAQDLIAAAAAAMHPSMVDQPLNLSLNLQSAWAALGMSLLLGTLVFLLWDKLHIGLEWMDARLGRISVVSVYERSLDWIPLVAAAITRRLQHGILPVYVATLLGSVTFVLGAGLWLGRTDTVWPAWEAPSAGVVSACCLIILGAIATALIRDRLVLLLANGLIGYGSAILFLFLGSPDLAYTQFTVETIFVIVVAAILLKLKRLEMGNSVAEPRWRPMAALLAATVASVLTLLLLMVYGATFNPQLSEYFGHNSVVAAHGRNVVNVILVDFRAMDTLGEISVVMLSLLAALPLLRALRLKPAGGQA
ncbi:MAG: hydrogen gas-evolving membrane-bound hydrogenase subunit E [Thiolinea sp.]